MNTIIGQVSDTVSLTSNLDLLLPEFMLAGLVILILAVDLFLPTERKRLLGWLSVAGLVVILAVGLVVQWDEDTSLYRGLIAVDNYTLFFSSFFIVIGAVIILSSMDYVSKYLSNPGEYYGLILVAVLAMTAMAAATELLTAYIALELMSFSFYTLASFARDNPKSNEAGVKYILVGAFSSAILLFGLSMMYGVVGATRYVDIADALTTLQSASDVSPALWVGLGLLLAGLGFKIAAVPFHMWAPDVYEGAPLPVTAYLAIGSKAAAFALILRFFTEGLMPSVDDWGIIVAVLAAVTMTVGNLVAIAQHNIKRLLAYSSIGQVGFLLVGIAALSTDSNLGSNSVMIHLVGYAVTNMAVFAGVIAFFNSTGKEEIADFAGLGESNPFLAAVISVGLFSLAGLPFFAGFTTKFYLFAAAASEGLLWLAALAIFNSLISLYYYLMVVKQMYIQPVPVANPHPINISTTPVMLGVLTLTVLGIFFVGVYPSPLVDAAEAATAAILS